MSSFLRSKVWIVLLSVLALGALFELASGLGNMSFHDAQAFRRENADKVGNATQGLVNSLTSIPLMTQLFFWLLIFLMVVLIGLVLSPELRKRLLWMFIRAALIWLGLYFLFS